jgi:hypothetical protein
MCAPYKDHNLIKLAFHRNGISGDPFYVALAIDSHTGDRVVIIRFDYDDIAERKMNRCAVLGVGQLAEGDIGFGSNSWRGDHYVEAMDRWIAAWNRERFGHLSDDEANPKDNG